MAEAGTQVTLAVERFGLGDVALRARYDALFEECPRAFIQQSTLWAEVIAELGPDEPLFLLCTDAGRDVAGLPLYVFRGPFGAILSSVPQAGPLGGVFCRPGLAREAREAAYAALIEAALAASRERDATALSLITNPFDPDLELVERHMEPDLVLENFTQFVPLDEIVEGRQLKLRDWQRRSNLSRCLKRARAAGFAPLERPDAAAFDAWYAIHAERHQEIGARPLPRRLLENIRRVLEPRGKAFFQVLTSGSEIASGTLFIGHREVLDVFMLSMNSRFAESQPNFLGTELSLFEARERGHTIYNWQSSPGRGSGVHRYKEQWGSQERAYAFVTRLFHRERIAGRSADEVRAGYPGHYVAPYAAFLDGFASSRYAK